MAGAIGWLYLLRSAGALDAGPGISASLPLEQLAGGDTQPLLRLIVAWLPAGLVAGLALRWSGLSLRPRLAVAGIVALLVLIASGAVSDATAISGSISGHISPQFTKSGTWVAVLLFGLGVAVTAALDHGRDSGSQRPGRTEQQRAPT